MVCTICQQTQVYSTDEEVDYCIICWFTGKVFERFLSGDERANLLQRIRGNEKVVKAEVWHYGQGMFSLSIVLADGRLVTPGVPGEMFGQKIVVPMIPPAGDEWGVMVARPVEEENEWANSPTVLPDSVDDDGLVRLIEEIS